MKGTNELYLIWKEQTNYIWLKGSQGKIARCFATVEKSAMFTILINGLINWLKYINCF